MDIYIIYVCMRTWKVLASPPSPLGSSPSQVQVLGIWKSFKSSQVLSPLQSGLKAKSSSPSPELDPKPAPKRSQTIPWCHKVHCTHCGGQNLWRLVLLNNITSIVHFYGVHELVTGFLQDLKKSEDVLNLKTGF